MIYLSAAYHYHRERRSFVVWLGDSALAICAWGIVGAGALFAVLPIWV
jgi:hypothetical protein